ncbi:MAG: DUF5683 domain-containing protein [Chitinophagales bacterium]|nr:DUF5683 domain-containing protein [Chitinophagales bacterium]
MFLTILLLFILLKESDKDLMAQDSLRIDMQIDSLLMDSSNIGMKVKDSILTEKDTLGVEKLKLLEEKAGVKKTKSNLTEELIKNSKKPEKEEKVLDPEQVFARKAAKWAILPGGGQIYNKKWWKAPIAWSMIGAGVYFIYNSASNMRVYNQALDMRNSGNVDRFNGVLSEDQVISYRNYYRRNLQLSIFGTAGLWTLTILDAVVDAHLKTYDISDDLSIKFKPKVLRVYNNSVPSLAITLYL